MAGAAADGRYNFSHERRGTAIIFNNVDFKNAPKRVGSDVDMMFLRETFEHLGFDPDYDIFIYRNETTTGMIRALVDCEYQTLSM